jgi:hypothetical protein
VKYFGIFSAYGWESQRATSKAIPLGFRDESNNNNNLTANMLQAQTLAKSTVALKEEGQRSRMMDILSSVQCDRTGYRHSQQ